MKHLNNLYGALGHAPMCAHSSIIQLFPLVFPISRLMIPLAHPQNSGPLEANCVCQCKYIAS